MKLLQIEGSRLAHSWGYGRPFVSSENLFQLQTSWWSPQKPYLNHKCLSFLNHSQVLVSRGILGPIKALWQWLSPPGPPQGSTLLLTSPLLPSTCSSSAAPRFWLAKQSTQQTHCGQCLFSLFSSLLPCSGASLAYQRQSTSVMWPNHVDTHLACSSKDSYEYSGWCQRGVRSRKEEMRVTDNGGCVSRKGKGREIKFHFYMRMSGNNNKLELKISREQHSVFAKIH